MKNLFNMSTKYVIIYAKNEDINLCAHVKFRRFSDYINQYLLDWDLIEYIPNKYPQHILGQDNNTTSPSDFYIYKKNTTDHINSNESNLEESNLEESNSDKQIIIHRESELIKEPASIIRLKYIEEVLENLNLPESSRILDFGGNQFSNYCNQKKYKYEMLDLNEAQQNGTGGYFKGNLTYDGRNIPLDKQSFDVIIVSFVLHHASSNTIYLLQQLKEITTKYIIICEDLCAIDYPISWHKRCFNHQNEGIFRSDEEWKFIFNSLNLNLIDILNIRCERDKEFSDPYDYIYRIQYTLSI